MFPYVKGIQISLNEGPNPGEMITKYGKYIDEI